MVLPASGAVTFTNNAITNSDTFDVTTEVNLAEASVYGATAGGLFTILYNARIIGNPIGPPNVSTNLTANQQSFYGVFVSAGYLLDIDPASGRWIISWSPTGPESVVNVYTFRTTLEGTGPLPGQTINTIKTFFSAQTPVINTVVLYNGTLSEEPFGGSGTTFYEYTIVATQSTKSTDFSTILNLTLENAGIGYTDENCIVYKLV